MALPEAFQLASGNWHSMRDGRNLTPGSTTDPPPPILPTMMGTSATPVSPHGNIKDWEGYRAYNFSTMNALANGSTGQHIPKFLAYSETGSPFSGSAASITTHVKSVLDTFYYNPASSQTHSTRWGIKLYWSNGNENYTTGKIPNVTNYVTSMQGLHDAIHFIDPVTSARRYPDAFAGSNPTTNQEFGGDVQTALHASALYHDFVMWSMYPLDLGNDGDVITYDWPSLTESDRTNSKLGYLIRCFYRTQQAQAQARTDLSNPTFRLAIGSGEGGNTRSPGDTTLRPYWAVNAFYRGAAKLSAQYDIDMPFLCWWDDGGGLYAGGQTVAGRSTEFGADDTGSAHPANPTTAFAWRNAPNLVDDLGGTEPTQWSANPKVGWTTSGPVH